MENVELPISIFLTQVLEAVKSFGGIPWTLKIASVILLIIASMKVSMIRPLWDKLGWRKNLLAPLLGLIAGVLMLSKENMLTLPGVGAYLFAGAGAIILHEILDAVKEIPGIGNSYLKVIEFMQGLLKKPASPKV